MTTTVANFNHDLALAGPVGSLDAYIQAVGAIPVLSREDEQALARSLRDDEDLDAARDLVMAPALPAVSQLPKSSLPDRSKTGPRHSGGR